MTKQEAKEFLKCKLMDTSYISTEFNYVKDVFNIAIECIEKQIPKKPNKVRCLNGKFAYLCPTCGGGLMSMCRCHYAECGQAILWESDNDV